MEQTNLDIYGFPPIPWSRALEQLEAGSAQRFWLSTTRPDGRPHVTGVGAKWADGKLYFTSGARTRKSRNLAVNPNCAVSANLPDLDLVLEGTVERVKNEATVARLAELYSSQGWPAEASGQAITAPYSAPSAGPSPWELFVLTVATAFGVATAEPFGATRWRFD